MPAFVAQSWPPEAGEANIAAKKHEKASKNEWNRREKEQAQPGQEGNSGRLRHTGGAFAGTKKTRFTHLAGSECVAAKPKLG
jgi:hypothetical protein